jgi:hypothetical protein
MSAPRGKRDVRLIAWECLQMTDCVEKVESAILAKFQHTTARREVRLVMPFQIA